MAQYAVEMNRTASATLSVGNIVADATRPRRSRLYYASFGSEATPGDFAYLWQIQRCTTAGTASAVTPQPLDMADAATETKANENHTVEPTLTANAILLAMPGNQRATVIFQTLPEFGLVIPATASAGLAFRTPTAGALVAVTVTAQFREE